VAGGGGAGAVRRLLLWKPAPAASAMEEGPPWARPCGLARLCLGVRRLLANAALITTMGFILSCTLCFVLAVRGCATRGKARTASAHLGQDGVTGVLISAPVYWMFTQFLAINLPGLTQTGWL
jgi:putative tricarboxylic transport membrane protein